MKHVILAIPMGWDKNKQVITFDADQFTREEAMAQFEEFNGRKDGMHLYTAYKYNGTKYYKIQYIGKVPDNKVPRNEKEAEYYLLRKPLKSLIQDFFGA